MRIHYIYFERDIVNKKVVHDLHKQHFSVCLLLLILKTNICKRARQALHEGNRFSIDKKIYIIKEVRNYGMFAGTLGMKSPAPAPAPSAPPDPAQSATTPPPSRPAAARCPNPAEPCPCRPETSGHAHCPASSPAQRRRRRSSCRKWT
jgi:hypothetical protein